MPHKRVDLGDSVCGTQVHPVVGGRLVVLGDGPERAALEAVAGSGVRFAAGVDETQKVAPAGPSVGTRAFGTA